MQRFPLGTFSLTLFNTEFKTSPVGFAEIAEIKLKTSWSMESWSTGRGEVTTVARIEKNGGDMDCQ